MTSANFRGEIKMKLSTKGRYGVRLMLELALHYGEGPIPLKEIAERQDISEKYLGHLIPSLKASNLINSTQGAYGGYSLAKPPQDITLDEVIGALEGNIVLVECVNKSDFCDKTDTCVTREIWKEMTEKMMECLKDTDLQELVNRKKQKQDSQLMYNI